MEVTWKPTTKQEQFLSLPDSIYEALYGGSAGSGKSEVLLMLPIIRGFYKHPKFKGLLLRRTFPELEQSLILRSQEIYPLTGGVYQKQDKRWTWPNGGIIQFSHMEHEKDARKFDTTEWNYIGFDESTSFTPWQYTYIAMSRCRTSTSDLPAIVRSASNPGNIGHGYFRKRFVAPSRDGGRVIKDSTGKLRIFIKALLSDNPHLVKNDPQYESRLQSLPEAERRAKLGGDWWTFSGQVFDDFRVDHFPDEPDNAIHVVKPFTIPSWWPRIIAVDWGFSAMMCCLWLAVSPDGRLYVYREFTCKRVKVSEWGNEIKNRSAGENFSDAVLCASAWQERGEEKPLYLQIQEATGIPFRKADNSRIAGKILLQELMRWKPLPFLNPLELNMDIALRLLKTEGVDAYQRYVSIFAAKSGGTEVIPKLQIFNTCEVLVETLPLCVYNQGEKEDPDPNTASNPEDVKEFSGDDPYDCLRYGCMSYDAFISGAVIKFNELQRVQDAENFLKTTGDMTGYYRRMENLERVDRKKLSGVRK